MKIEYTTAFFNKKPLLILRRNYKKGETLNCPFCEKKHGHGFSDGHRIAHCQNIKNKTVTAEDGTVLHQKDGYVLINF
jgi:hypothetical protein